MSHALFSSNVICLDCTMKMRFHLICLLSVVLWIDVYVVGQDEGPVVSTIYGDVRGLQEFDRMNRTYDVFLGVPFAKPPVGSLRWKPSEAPEPWDGILNATEFSVHCIQPMMVVYEATGYGSNDSEDCLHLNVYVPNSIEYALANPLPVMVWYYGGGLAIGMIEMYTGEELAIIGDVIVVTANYRVGPMGFLSTGDSASPGNYGFWDAKTSLEWVNDNIQFFGGDPSRITVFGQSAGGNVVSHLMLSPQTNLLFQRAISISGGATYDENPNPKNQAQHLADLFNCSTTDSQEIVDCLMEKDGKEIDNRYYVGLIPRNVTIGFMEAVIDGTFVVQDTRDSWKQGIGRDIDKMSGYTHHDSAGFVFQNVLANPNNRSNDGNKDNIELYEYVYQNFRTYDNVDELVQALYDRFPGMNDSDPAIATEWVSRVFTDFTFASRSFYECEKHVEAQGLGSTYHYEFRHRQKFQDAYPAWVNGSHLDDIYSVFGDPFNKVLREGREDNGDFSDEDFQLSELIMKYYANFAYSGNPNQGRHVMDVQWPAYDLVTREYLLETPTPIVLEQSQEMQDHYNWFVYDFWGMMRPGWGVPLDWSNYFLQDMFYEDVLF